MQQHTLPVEIGGIVLVEERLEARLLLDAHDGPHADHEQHRLHQDDRDGADVPRQVEELEEVLVEERLGEGPCADGMLSMQGVLSSS